MKLTRAEVVLALSDPDLPRYRKLLGQARWALERLRIGVYLVRENGTAEPRLENCHGLELERFHAMTHVAWNGATRWLWLGGNDLMLT